MSRQLTPLRAAAFLAFNELENTLSHHSGSAPSTALNDQLIELPTKSALFVTWTKRDRLRGCIGTFSRLPVTEGVKRYALIAALEDSRFSPIRASELPKLEVAVTLLGRLEKCADPFDWEIGLHGVEAIFKDGRSATFLPEVPEEQGWSKQDTLTALAEKAGTRNSAGMELFKYKGTKEKMTYEQYSRHKQELGLS